jgi:hypothetical protein
MRFKLLPACLLSALPALLSGQTVRGVVVDQLDRPIPGVVLQLTDSTSRAYVRTLTNERGEFRLTAPSEGRYRVRSTRIGFQPTNTDFFTLRVGAELTQRIVLASRPIVLDPVRSVVRTSCRMLGLDSTAITFTAWEQVRAALAAADLTAETQQLATTTLTYDRTRTLEGVTVQQAGRVTTAKAAQPWHSLSGDSLRKMGYVILDADGKGRVFHGPDLRVLGSDLFAEDHCFHIAASPDSTRFGIAFEPTPQRKDMPEIVGTVWLDRATSELREMEWQYINVARNIDETATGGAMHFARLRNGLWLISRWNIHMPFVTLGGGSDANSITFRGVKTLGGELIAASSASGNDTLWTGPRMTLHGYAFDSLSKQALTSALVGIAGGPRSTITDSAGNFTFENLMPGVYRLITQHDALEAIGVPYHVTTAVFTSEADTANITMPSFETIWRLSCESAPPARDTALVFGTVRGIGRSKPIVGATVFATWVDVATSGKRKFETKRWHIDGPSDSTGTYVLCGVPTQTGLRLRAVSDSAESGIIDLLPLNEKLVQRQDMSMSFDPGKRGVVNGLVLGRNAMPIGGARVIAEGSQETRTDAFGKFSLRDVPLGTQQVEVIAIGLQPTARTVEVSLLDTAFVELHITKPQMLQKVNIVASSVRQQLVIDFMARRDKGLGLFRDSTLISQHGTLNSVFMAVQGVRMVRDQVFLPRGSGQCNPIVWLDGVNIQTVDVLLALRPSDLAAIEIYMRELIIPPQFVVRNTRTQNCGAIVAWTKWYWEGNRGSKPPG